MQVRHITRFCCARGLGFLTHCISRHTIEGANVRVRPNTAVNEHLIVSRNINVMVNRAARVNSSILVCRNIALNNANGSINGHRPAVNGGIVVDTNTGILNPFGVKSGSHITTNTIILSRIPPGSAIINIPTEVMGRSNGHITLSRVRLPSPMGREVSSLRKHVVRLRTVLGRGGWGVGVFGALAHRGSRFMPVGRNRIGVCTYNPAICGCVRVNGTHPLYIFSILHHCFR